MRLAHTFESHRTLDVASPLDAASQRDEAALDRTDDALASACLFGILGGLLFGVAVLPAISVVLVGSALGAIVGLVVAYH